MVDSTKVVLIHGLIGIVVGIFMRNAADKVLVIDYFSLMWQCR